MTAPRPLGPRDLAHLRQLGRPRLPNKAAPPVWWTVAEIAERWRVSKMTVYRLVHLGELPARQFGRSYRVNAEALADYEATVATAEAQQ